MAWTLLVIAGLLEIVWAVALKQTGGSLRPAPTVIVIFAATASLVLLAAALRTLPVGTAYAVWVGIGAAGVTLAGILAFHETPTPSRLAFIALILIGVAGLRAVEPRLRGWDAPPRPAGDRQAGVGTRMSCRAD